MKKLLLCLCATLMIIGCAKTKDVYMFTSHREPALDGLHFLYSYDGLHWDSLPGSWLRPEIGNNCTKIILPTAWTHRNSIRNP